VSVCAYMRACKKQFFVSQNETTMLLSYITCMEQIFYLSHNLETLENRVAREKKNSQ
jgi:hypothetical protein